MRLPAFLALACAMAAGCTPWSSPQPSDEPLEGPTPQVVDPAPERREVVRPAVDTEDWEIGVMAGALSVEDFGSEPIWGARVAFHATEDVFLEARWARSTVSDASFRRLGAPLFDAEEQDLDMYDLSLGFLVLPGEVFLGSRWARTSGVYFSFGAGTVEFADVDSVNYLLGFGLKVLPTDWLSLRLEARDNIFESDLLGENEWKHNFEVTLGVAAFF